MLVAPPAQTLKTGDAEIVIVRHLGTGNSRGDPCGRVFKGRRARPFDQIIKEDRQEATSLDGDVRINRIAREYHYCAHLRAGIYARDTDDPAETVAIAALTACREEAAAEYRKVLEDSRIKLPEDSYERIFNLSPYALLPDVIETRAQVTSGSKAPELS